MTRLSPLPWLLLLVGLGPAACDKTPIAPHAAGGGGGPAGNGGLGGRGMGVGGGPGGGPGGAAGQAAGGGGQAGAGGFGNAGGAFVRHDCAPLFIDGGMVTTQPYNGPRLRGTDLNANGKPALIVADLLTYELLSKGDDGHFRPLGSYSVGARLFFDVATGDLNGDGLPDVVVSRDPLGQIPIGPPWLGVRMNRADGTLAEETAYSLDPANGREPYIALGDLDGDHLADVLVSGTKTLSVLTNAGGGKLNAPQPIASLAAARVALADVDRDGKLDIIVHAGSIRVMLNQGGLTFAPAQSDLPPDPDGVFDDFVVADLNGDGAADLAAIGHPQAIAAPSWWLVPAFNDGHGLLTRGESAAIPVNARGLTAGDFNADGRADLAVVTYGLPNGSITTLMVQKDMSYVATTCSTLVTTPPNQSKPDLVAADLNGDGRADLAVTAESAAIQLLISAAPTPSAPAGADQ